MTLALDPPIVAEPDETRQRSAALVRALRGKRLDIDEYNALIDTGAIHGRFELIEGEIVEMASAGNAHSVGLEDFRDHLRSLFPRPWFIRTQSTHRIGPSFAPDPDLVLVTRKPIVGARLDEPPTLVVEVSDSTLTKDLTKKKLQYARHGVPEYWVIDLHDRVVHVFRDPRVDATRHEEAYASARRVGLDGEVAPLVDPSKSIKVADFMPLAGALADEA